MDVTGAGDTFGAALVWCLGQGRGFGPALTFAVAAASRAVTRHGPRGGRASTEEVEAWRQAVSQAEAG